MDLPGFLYALVTDWVSLMSGVFSILLTAVAVWRPKTNVKKWFLGAALICYLIGPARIWTTEHRKIFGQTAFLDASLDNFYPNQPFPVNNKLVLYLFWEDVGTVSATKPRTAAKVYVLEATNNQAEDRAIQDWKSYWKDVLATGTVEGSDIYPHKPRSILAEGSLLTEQTARDVFIDKVKTLAVIGAIRFTDGAGEHEGHTCKWLSALQGTKTIWTDCHDYVTQVDIK